MLHNPGFVKKAPEAKVNQERDKLAKYQQELTLTQKQLNELLSK